MVYSLEKCKMFVLGSSGFIVVVDHKPLVKIFNDKPLESIENPRLFKLKERSLKFNFTVKYAPGSLNCSADALSRYPSSTVCSMNDALLPIRTCPTEQQNRHSIESNRTVYAYLQASLANVGDVAIISLSRVHDVANTDKQSRALLNTYIPHIKE